MTRHGDLLPLLRGSLAAFGARTFSITNPGETFSPTLAYPVIAHQLERVARGEIRRLLINVPPRSGKSLLASVALPAFVLGQDPTRRVICASYSHELAGKLGRDCRAVMLDPAYRWIFPGTVITEKNTETELQTRQRGFRLSTSVGGTLTGRGGNLIILDDPMKPEEANSRVARDKVHEWFRSTLLSRLDDKANDAIVVVMQRLHVDDLSGRLLEEGGWEHLCLPAIAEMDETFAVARGLTIDRTRGSVLDEVREPRPVLEELRRELGSATFEAQYQQSPVPSEGALVRWSWFGRHSGEPDLGPGDRWVISWDTATKGGEVNDYSVGVVALVRAAGAVEIVQVIRERLEFPNLRRRMLLEARRRPGSVTLIEDAGTGAALHQDLRHEAGMYAIAIRPEGDKVVRLTAVTPVIEAGKVSLPHDAPWLDVFKRELLSFPHSKNDDQVDALAQLLNWADKRRYSFAYSRQI